jgi:hypothetical protein
MAGRRHLAAGGRLVTLGLPVAAVLLTAGRWLLAACHWALEGRHSPLNTGHTRSLAWWSLAFGYLVEVGRWSLAAGIWSAVDRSPLYSARLSLCSYWPEVEVSGHWSTADKCPAAVLLLTLIRWQLLDGPLPLAAVWLRD